MLIVLFFVFALFFFLVPSLVNQLLGFTQHIPEYRKTLEDSILSDDLRILIHNDFNKVPDQIGSMPEKVAMIGTTTVHALYRFILLVILSLYFLIDGDRAYQAILKEFDKYGMLETKQKLMKTGHEIRRVIFSYATGQMITCSFVAIYVYAVTRILQVPGALTLAAIAAICDLIPVIGFITSLAIAALVAYTVSPATSLILVSLYLLCSLLENYLIIPRVYGHTMKLSRLVVLLSILIGGELGGIEGMLLVLPIAGSWRIIEQYWIEPNVKRGQTTSVPLP